MVGAVIMVTLYTLGKIYVYSTFEYAMIKLPYEIAQALLGIVGSMLLCFRGGLFDSFRRIPAGSLKDPLGADKCFSTGQT